MFPLSGMNPPLFLCWSFLFHSPRLPSCANECILNAHLRSTSFHMVDSPPYGESEPLAE